MQKISSYLYSNRILVLVDLDPYPVEWKIVYQRMIKIYQGLDNIIEFDVKNSYQRRIDISSYTIKCVITDEQDKEIFTGTLVPQVTLGLAKLTIPLDATYYVKPQFLKYCLYIEETNGMKIPVYADAQYGLIGKIELIGGAMPTEKPAKIIDSFIYIIDDTNPSLPIRTYTSDAVEVNPLNDYRENAKIDLEFRLKSLDATVTVQITDDYIVNASTKWHDLETFITEPSTSRLYKSYQEVADFSNNVGWLRIKYVPSNTNTGTFDKILVTM